MNTPACRVLAWLVAFALSGSLSSAQAPTGPPPPRGQGSNGGSGEIELLPDLGRIGAEAAALAGVSWNPYSAGRGGELAGYVNLPLRRVPGGKLSYELFLGVGWATSAPVSLGVGVPVLLPPLGPPSVPTARVRLRVIDASPFGLKYVFVHHEGSFRPYLNAGIDALVSVAEEQITRVTVVAQGSAGVPGFDGGVPQAPARIAIGGHGAAGVEIRLGPALSLNAEYRITVTEGQNGRLQLLSGALGFHW